MSGEQPRVVVSQVILEGTRLAESGVCKIAFSSCQMTRKQAETVKAIWALLLELQGETVTAEALADVIVTGKPSNVISMRPTPPEDQPA